MDRIELDEQIELEQYKKKEMKPLDLAQNTVLSRLQVKKATNHAYTKGQDVATQIWSLLEPYKDTPPKDPEKLKKWRPFTFKALLGIIWRKGPDYCFQCYRQIQEEFDRGNVENPLPLFLWKISQCKVGLKEVELK